MGPGGGLYKGSLEAAVGAGGLHRSDPPLLVDSAAGRRIPPNPTSPTPHPSLCHPSCDLGPGSGDPGHWVLPDRISERIQEPDGSGQRSALRQLCYSGPLGIALLGPWTPWRIGNWWWFLEPQVSESGLVRSAEPGPSAPHLQEDLAGRVAVVPTHVGGQGRQNLSADWF